jgi:hypothetical protein
MNPESTGTSQPQPQFPKGPLAPPTLRERLQRLTKTRLVVGGLLALVLITGLIVYVVNQNTFKPAGHCHRRLVSFLSRKISTG